MHFIIFIVIIITIIIIIIIIIIFIIIIIAEDPCSLKPCIHGTCFSQPSGGYRCTCQPGYTGAACDTGISPL